MPLPPFDSLIKERDPYAWYGGVRRKPTWQRRPGLIDRAGFHALLRAAQLPIAELRHMGASDEMLAKGTWVEESGAIMLLGRIAWDASWGIEGSVWTDSPLHRAHAAGMGRKIIEEFFTCR